MDQAPVLLQSFDGNFIVLSRMEVKHLKVVDDMLKDAQGETFLPPFPHVVDGNSLDLILLELRGRLRVDALHDVPFIQLMRASNYLDFSVLSAKMLPTLAKRLLSCDAPDHVYQEMSGFLFEALFSLPGEDAHRFALKAARFSKVHIDVDWLDERRRMYLTWNTDYAISHGHTKIFIQFYKDHMKRNLLNGNYLSGASEKGYADIVKFFLDTHTFHHACGSPLYRGIVRACKNGHLEVVKLLLPLYANPMRVVPSDCIKMATRGKHVRIVEELLKHPGVDPSVDEDYAIRRAARYGDMATVNVLLTDSRVNGQLAEVVMRTKRIKVQ